jgi:hypothetical protein
LFAACFSTKTLLALKPRRLILFFYVGSNGLIGSNDQFAGKSSGDLQYKQAKT